MRQITFPEGEEGKNLFHDICEGWIVTSVGLKGIETIRNGCAVLDALEAVSAPIAPKKGEPVTRELKDGVTCLLMEEGPFKLLKTCLEVVEWKTTFARRAEALYLALEHAKIVNPNKGG